MERRSFLAVAGMAVATGTTGCLSGEDEPQPVLASLELENHRRDGRYPFAVEVQDGDETVFERSLVLEPADEDGAATVFEEPVDEPGAYSVLVTAGDYSATATTDELASADEPCLHIRCYLGERTLHLEHRTFQQC